MGRTAAIYISVVCLEPGRVARGIHTLRFAMCVDMQVHSKRISCGSQQVAWMDGHDWLEALKGEHHCQVSGAVEMFPY